MMQKLADIDLEVRGTLLAVFVDVGVTFAAIVLHVHEYT